MSTSFPRIAAAVLLAVGGFMVTVSAFGIVMAKLVVAAGLPAVAGRPVTAADAALLSDLVAVSPFIAGFGLLNFAAAGALIAGTSWAKRAATAVAASGAVVGAIGLTLLILGRDPFTNLASNRALDGIELVGSFVIYYVITAALAVAIGRVSIRTRTTALAA